MIKGSAAIPMLEKTVIEAAWQEYASPVAPLIAQTDCGNRRKCRNGGGRCPCRLCLARASEI